MTIRQLALLLTVSIGMSFGQILFKLSAEKARNSDHGLLHALAINPVFLLAIGLYAAMTLLWVHILTTMKLSIAYPFMAVSFVTTPMLASFMFEEPLTLRYWLGLAAIVAGILMLPQR